ncbi:hypothetical protein Voc01_009180 [Virgisporangium ochraceum]|uniref:Uncharacterized protein n=1 Tax=Virgisporangium ochraceum TaxID=65505 RepID=A0A8J3ZLK3_9ACTN|nr:hypothetical protein Voc01_009180 [Virgisporangium ochraceum]
MPLTVPLKEPLGTPTTGAGAGANCQLIVPPPVRPAERWNEDGSTTTLPFDLVTILT